MKKRRIKEKKKENKYSRKERKRARGEKDRNKQGIKEINKEANEILD